MGRPMLWRYERMASSMGYLVVAGVDEVGMGPLAGPVVGGAVVLPIGVEISGLDGPQLIRVPQRERVQPILPRQGGGASRRPGRHPPGCQPWLAPRAHPA